MKKVVTLLFICYSLLLKSETVFESHIRLQPADNKDGATPVIKSVLIICDNYVSPENNAIAQGVRVDMSTVSQFLNIIENRGIAKVEKTILQGRNATLDKINIAVNALQTSPNDIIFVYFSGHGGMASGKTFLYTSDERNLMRSDLQNVINGKPGRLKMIVTDACNNETEGMAASRSLSRGASSASEGKFDAIYKDLFTNYKGILHLSASSEGQYAWSDDNMGGFFTHYFFKESLIKSPDNKWETNYKNAKDKTSQMFKMMPAEQRSQLAKEGIMDQTAKSFSMPQLAVTDNTNTGNTDTGVTPTTSDKSIRIKNLSGKTVNYLLDKNTDLNNWQESFQEEKTIAAGASANLGNKPKVMIGLQTGAELSYYDLEPGNYFFDEDEFGQVDLFLEEEGKTADEVSKRDYTTLLVGNWEWEDQEGVLHTQFASNGTFTDKDEEDQLTEEGSWKVSKIQDEDTKEYYPILDLTLKDEDGSFDVMYLLFSESDDLVQLIYLGTFVNGKMVEEDDSEGEEAIMLMYRK